MATRFLADHWTGRKLNIFVGDVSQPSSLFAHTAKDLTLGVNRQHFHSDVARPASPLVLLVDDHLRRRNHIAATVTEYPSHPPSHAFESTRRCQNGWAAEH